MNKKFNLGKLINERQQADRKAAKQATEVQPAKKPTDPQADLQRSRETLAAARKVCESITNPWKQYRSLQASGDPTAAGVYYRKNKAAIAACRTNH